MILYFGLQLLAWQVQFQTFRWYESIADPEITTKETERLLSFV